MSLTIIAVLFFSVILLFVDNKNKYNYFFILMMLGMATAMATIIVDIAKSSNYILPPDYVFRSLETVLYNWINRALKSPLSTRLVMRNIGVSVYLVANVMFVFSFGNSVVGSEKSNSFYRRIGRQFFLLFIPLIYFLFYHPYTAYHIYIAGYNMTLAKKLSWFAFIKAADVIVTICIALYLAYPIIYLLINHFKNRITFFAEQMLGLAVSLALLNSMFLFMFFLGMFQLSALSVTRTGLWRYAFLDRIPQFYVTALPILMLVIEGIVLYMIIRFKASDIVNGLKSRMMRKSLSSLYQNQRDILHSNKNLMFRIKLLSDEALAGYGTEDGLGKLEAIQSLCSSNMDTISKTLDYIKVLTIHTMDNDFIEAIENALRSAAIPDDIEIIRQYHQPQIPCYFDMFHMEHTILNLLSNAVDAIRSYYGEKPRIRITVHASANWVYCTISDTGCGIPPKMLKRIFDPYVSTKSKQNNWGLGLAYAQRIIKAHYGQIRFRPSKKTRGTVVEILLPRSLPYRKKMIKPASD